MQRYVQKAYIEMHRKLQKELRNVSINLLEKHNFNKTPSPTLKKCVFIFSLLWLAASGCLHWRWRQTSFLHPVQAIIITAAIATHLFSTIPIYHPEMIKRIQLLLK